MKLFRRKEIQPKTLIGRSEAVADLDAMLTQDVEFKLFDKMHKIKPLTVQQFLVVTAALADIYDLQKRQGITPQELIEKYYALVSGCCDSISKKDIENMTQQQVAALFELITQTVTGKIFAEKKTLKMMS